MRYASRRSLPFFSVSIPNEDLIRQEIKRALFWTFRDGTDNILNHANATEVQVTCRVEGEDLVFLLTDNGRGFTFPDDLYELKAKGHLGVLSILTEIESVGGQATFQSTPGRGTTIKARFTNFRILEDPAEFGRKKEKKWLPNALRN